MSRYRTISADIDITDDMKITLLIEVYVFYLIQSVVYVLNRSYQYYGQVLAVIDLWAQFYV